METEIICSATVLDNYLTFVDPHSGILLHQENGSRPITDDISENAVTSQMTDILYSIRPMIRNDGS